MARGLDWYSAQFHPGEQHRAWGESTPFYLYKDRAREAMVQALPESLEGFAEAIAQEPERLGSSKDGQPASFSYLDRGHYLRQLTVLESRVGRDRMLVMLTDDLWSDPRDAVRQVCRFVGLDESGADTVEVRRRYTFTDRTVNSADALRKPRVQQQHVETSGGYPPIDPKLEQRLREQFRSENEDLAKWLGVTCRGGCPAES